MAEGVPLWWGWRRQLGPLAAADYHVVVPDQRGYNGSEAPPEVSDHGLDPLTADVVALADSFGAARFDLVAHDWGAVIGWWVAARRPDRLKRAVLMDGPPRRSSTPRRRSAAPTSPCSNCPGCRKVRAVGVAAVAALRMGAEAANRAAGNALSRVGGTGR